MSARPFYPHEADDPDLDWLVSNFLYERPNYIPVESGSLPIMLMPYHELDERVQRPQSRRRKSQAETPILEEE